MQALEEISSELVLLLGSGVTLSDDQGLWQGIKQLELLHDAVAVGGPLLDAGAAIRWGPIIALPDGTLADPMLWKRYSDPGSFSLAHKPH